MLLEPVPVIGEVDRRVLDPDVEDGPVGRVELLNAPEDDGIEYTELNEDVRRVPVETMLEGTEVVTVVHDETVTVEVIVFEAQEAVTVTVTVGNS